ncbi:hypothetical protein K466DRAFT_668331 [Polyporus arcularius HHB13444]|uniref:Homeobox domain-containing protein n=1 Tax=Polyporus arcularius HHB13444 TaxID=1314778 RepID=A0A5C3NQ11_9APHY|nr:hypothetical protein K466DRAFT_668331 [Polyporus arcularius HHB13444]
MSSPYPNHHGNSGYNGPPSTSAYPITSYSSLDNWDGSKSKDPSQTDHPASASALHGLLSTSANPITSYSSLDNWDGSKSKDPSQTDHPASASTLAPATPTASRSYQAHQSSSTDTRNPPPATDHHSIIPFMVHDGYPPSTTGVRTTYSGAHHFPGGSSHATASGVGTSTHNPAYGLAGGHAPVFLLPGEHLPEADRDRPDNITGGSLQDSYGATTNATYSAGPPVPAEGDPKSVSEILEEAYTAGHIRPSYNKRVELAGTAGLPLAHVNKWFSFRRLRDPDYVIWRDDKRLADTELTKPQQNILKTYYRENGTAPPILKRAELAKDLGVNSAYIYGWFFRRLAHLDSMFAETAMPEQSMPDELFAELDLD